MNKNILYSIIIIALLGGYLFLSKERSDSFSDLPELTSVIDEIVITQKESTLFVKKKKNNWFINKKEFPAVDSKIEDMIKKIKDIKIDLISENKFYTNYDLTEDKGITVTLKAEGKELRKIVVGKKSPNSSHSFVKVDSKTEIFSASNIYQNDFKKKVENLRNKEIFKISKDAVKGIKIKFKNKTFSLFKKVVEKKSDKQEDKKEKKKPETEEIWICKEFPKVKLDKKKVESLFGSFTPLNASSYPEIEKDKLKNAIASLSIDIFDRKITLDIYKTDNKEKFNAASSESKYVFTLNKWLAEKFFITNLGKLKSSATK